MPEKADTSETDPIVCLTAVNQSFGDNQVIKGISFDVAKGEVICIIGPSGSGKSTLLRCINGLIEIDSGSIKVKDMEVHAPQLDKLCLLYTSPSPRDGLLSRMPSSA